MLSNTRVSRAPDATRIAQMVSRPGIDPRIWVSLAAVRAVHVDPTEGVFVDVILLPSRLEATARLGVEYAGDGFGLYTPPAEGDEVEVTAPSGDPAEGLVVARRLHSPSDPPPQAVVDHPEDVILVVKPGATLRLAVSGGGKLLAGGVDSSSPFVLGDVLVRALTELLTQGKLVSHGVPCVADPAWVTKYLTAPLTNIVSQRAFTERGP